MWIVFSMDNIVHVENMYYITHVFRICESPAHPMWTWPGNKTTSFMFHSRTWPIWSCMFHFCKTPTYIVETSSWHVHPSKLRLALWNGRAASVTDIFCVSRQQRYAWYIRSKKKSSLAAFWISCQWKEEQLHCEDRQPTICGKANSWKVSHKFEKPPPNSTPQGVRSASWKKRKLKRRPKWKWSGKGAEKECERKQGYLKASHQLTLAKSLKSWQTYEKSSRRHAWSKKTLWPIFSQEKTIAGAVWHLLCKEWHWLTQELTSERLWMKC